MLTFSRRFILSSLIAFAFALGVMETPGRTGAQGSSALTAQAFTVEASQYRYFPFRVPSETRSLQVAGRFRAQGGSGNDIQVLLLDEDGFENYKNGHGTGTYYNSGRVTVGRVNVRLAPGQYYLVFNNSYSLVTNKAVTSDIALYR